MEHISTFDCENGKWDRLVSMVVGGRDGQAAGGLSLEETVAALAARAGEHDRDATFPHEAFDLLHSTGVLNLTVPTALAFDLFAVTLDSAV